MIVPYDFTPILGGDKSVQFNPADLRNVIMKKADANGRIGWQGFPGLKLFGTGAGSDRGSHVMADERYLITGTTLWKEDQPRLALCRRDGGRRGRRIFQHQLRRAMISFLPWRAATAPGAPRSRSRS